MEIGVVLRQFLSSFIKFRRISAQANRPTLLVVTFVSYLATDDIYLTTIHLATDIYLTTIFDFYVATIEKRIWGNYCYSEIRIVPEPLYSSVSEM